MSLGASSNALVPGSQALSGHDADWRQLVFDLDAYAGRRVRLRFLYGSIHDDPLTGPRGRGWLLDDFGIQAGEPNPTDAGVPGLPTVLQVSATPNPFNPRVRLRIDVPAAAGHLRLDIVDARGRRLRRLLDGVVPAGNGAVDVVWDGTDAAGLASGSGVYYYRLHSRLGVQAGKLVLVR